MSLFVVPSISCVEWSIYFKLRRYMLRNGRYISKIADKISCTIIVSPQFITKYAVTEMGKILLCFCKKAVDAVSRMDCKNE